MYPESLVWLILVFAFLFGAIIGSFLNVCIYRVPRGYLSIVYPPSHCPHCGKWLRWFDNVPILSWLLLTGACRYCRSPIRFRYVFIETLTGVLFYLAARYVVVAPVSMFATLSEWDRWIGLVLVLYILGELVVITFIDCDYRIIPDGLTYPGILLAPVISALWPYFHQSWPIIFENRHLQGLIGSIVGILVGGGSLYLVGIVGKILFRKDAMGFGDVKMMAMMGGLLGWDSALLIFLLACIGGTVIGVLWMAITKDHYIPFGPYLAAGTAVILFLKPEILYMVFTLWPHWIGKWLGLSSMIY